MQFYLFYTLSTHQGPQVYQGWFLFTPRAVLAAHGVCGAAWSDDFVLTVVLERLTGAQLFGPSARARK
jgi:hypothetical protein